MVNDRWLQVMPHTRIPHHPIVGPNHCPLLMEMSARKRKPYQELQIPQLFGRIILIIIYGDRLLKHAIRRKPCTDLSSENEKGGFYS